VLTAEPSREVSGGDAEEMRVLSKCIPGSAGGVTRQGPWGGCTGSNWSRVDRSGREAGARWKARVTSLSSVWLNGGHCSLACNDCE